MCGKWYPSGEGKLFFSDEEQFDDWIRCYLSDARHRGTAVFLDSQHRGHASSRCSYIATDPVASVKLRSGEQAWQRLAEFRKKYPGWMFGWLAYDLKNEIEQLVSERNDPVGLPDLCFFVPGVLLEADRDACEIRVVKGELPKADLDRKRPHNQQPEQSGVKSMPYTMGPLVSGDGWERYCYNVLKIKDHIARGNTYEVNLTHQLQTHFKGDTLDLFDAMRKSGPVPFAAWLSHGEVEVCCASPERFLQRKAGRVRSQPIKGTSPRGADPEEDQRIIREILKKEKNRAENVMIVDLVRHDLGKVAITGTVRADTLHEVQSFSTVHQLVSTISAEVAPDASSVDILKACFPMGSMTGAPKVRTMQIIEELESYRRGLYSGAIGYFRPDGDFDFNVVIRTAIIRQNRLWYSVGGAITADSDPREEWEETWLKARALDPQASEMQQN